MSFKMTHVAVHYFYHLEFQVCMVFFLFVFLSFLLALFFLFLLLFIFYFFFCAIELVEIEGKSVL